MDKDKKTVGSLSWGDFESNDFLIKQGRGRSRNVVVNNFSNKDVLVMIGLKRLMMGYLENIYITTPAF